MVGRIFEILFSVIVLILVSPIIIFFSILIKIYDRGPVFADFPLRVGKDGVPFRMYKFRTMEVNSHEAIQSSPKFSKLKKKWEDQEKLPIDKDPRITPVGKFLRRTDLDELPQFLNVIKGDMSIVGPRPYFVDQLSKYLKRYPKVVRMWKTIKTVKPGITGLWQVSGRNKNTIPQRFEIEYRYVKERNIFKDLGIMIKTPFVILEHVIKGE